MPTHMTIFKFSE